MPKFGRVSNLTTLVETLQQPPHSWTKYIKCDSSCGPAYKIVEAIVGEFANMNEDKARVMVSIKVWTDQQTEKHVDFDKYDLVEKGAKEALVTKDSLVAIKHGGIVYLATTANEVVVQPVWSSRLCLAVRATILEPLETHETTRKIASAFGPRDVASCIAMKAPLEFTDAALEEYQQDEMQPLYFVPDNMVSATHVAGTMYELLAYYKVVVLVKDLKVSDLPPDTKRAIITPLVKKHKHVPSSQKGSKPVKALVFQVVLEDQSGSDVLVALGFPGTQQPENVNLLDTLSKLENLNFRREHSSHKS